MSLRAYLSIVLCAWVVSCGDTPEKATGPTSTELEGQITLPPVVRDLGSNKIAVELNVDVKDGRVTDYIGKTQETLRFEVVDGGAEISFKKHFPSYQMRGMPYGSELDIQIDGHIACSDVGCREFDLTLTKKTILRKREETQSEGAEVVTIKQKLSGDAKIRLFVLPASERTPTALETRLQLMEDSIESGKVYLGTLNDKYVYYQVSYVTSSLREYRTERAYSDFVGLFGAGKPVELRSSLGSFTLNGSDVQWNAAQNRIEISRGRWSHKIDKFYLGTDLY